MGEARCAAGEHQLFGEAAAADASGAVKRHGKPWKAMGERHSYVKL